MSDLRFTDPAGSRARLPRLRATELDDAIALSVQRALQARAEVSGGELQANPPGTTPINGVIIHPTPWPWPPINGVIIHPWPPINGVIINPRPPFVNGIIPYPELGQ